MKSYEEMAQSVFQRRDAYLQKKKHRQKIMMRVGIPALCFCLIVGLSCVIHFSGVWRKPASIDIVSSSSLSSLVESKVSVVSSQISQVDNESVNSQQTSSVVKSSSVISQKKTVSSKQANSSTVISVPDDSQSFKSVEEFRKYVKKLYASVTDNREQEANSKQQAYPSAAASSVNAAASGGHSYDESSLESSLPNESSQIFYPDNPPVCSAAPFPSVSSSEIKEDIWDSVFDMVDGGWFAAPKLGNGNQLLRLSGVKINDEGIYYQYRFKDKALQCDSSYDLMIALLPDDRTLQGEYQWVLQNGNYDTYTHQSITFTVCHPLSSDSNTRYIYWKQFGQYYVAYYQGRASYLPDILPSLALEITYLDE